MKWSVTEEMVSELSAKQRDILRTAVPYVRNGGLLVYATCSLFREENEDVVSSFLTDHTDFVPDERERTTGPSGRIFGGDTVRLTPHEDDSDGFFCAFLRRTAAA